MSERVERLYDGITGISDDIVERAEKYVFQEKRSYRGLAAWGTMAACACLIVVVTLPRLASGGSSEPAADCTTGTVMENMMETDGVEAPASQVVTDKEAQKEISVESTIAEGEALAMRELFPQKLLSGYVLSEAAAIYEGKVLQAKYYSEEYSDEMLIRIAHRAWYTEQQREVETGVIFYRDKPETAASYIYYAIGDYIIEYSFDSRDIAEITGFEEMVASAPCFVEE